MNDYVATSDGMHLWPNGVDCPHSNFNACPTCDFDRYYANKYASECPWSQDD